MNYLKVFDKFQTVFTGDGLALLDKAYNCKIKEVLNGELTLSFVLPRIDPNWQYIKEENFINIDGQNFRVKSFAEQRDESGKLLSNVQCEHVYYDCVNCKHIPLVEMIGYSPLQVLQAAFQDTRFTIDTVEVVEATDIFDSKSNPAKIVSQLIDNVGGELVRNNWTLSLVNKRGSDNGVQFKFGKNIKSLRRDTDTKSLITRLYVYGMDDLDITSVYATPYIDSPYIANYDRVHTNYKDYTDVEDPLLLLAKGLVEFSTVDKDGIDKPTVTYQIDVVELKKLVQFGSAESFSIGDIVTVIDEELGISTRQRIISYEHYPYEPLKSTVELSNNLSTIKNNLGSMMAGLLESSSGFHKITTNKGMVNASWLENIKYKLSTEINAQMSKALMHDHGDVWVDNLLAPTKAMAIVNGMFAIANAKKENGDWDWKAFGTGDGFTADLINAGKVHLSDNLTVENDAGTVALTSAGLKIIQADKKARALFQGNALSMQSGDGTGVNWVNRIYFDPASGKFIFSGTLEAADGIFTGTLQAADGVFKGSVTIDGDEDRIVLDQYGMDTKFIKWFKNMCYNSSFEVFDPATKLPAYWDGGVSSPSSNFFGDYSLKLAYGESSKQTAAINPQWYNSVSAKTRVSFHKKGGAVRISVLAADGTPFTLANESGATGLYIEYAANTNWLPESYTVSFTHGAEESIRVKFENSGAADAYIDGVIVEPDYTGKRPSFYSDGPNSIGTSTGKEIITVVETTETAVQAIWDGVQLFVGTIAEIGALTLKNKDVAIYSDDYSRYDRQSVSANASDTVSAAEFVEFTGTSAITYTLSPTGVTVGCIKKLKNSSSAIVTIIATINGTTGHILYPNEPTLELIWNGTDWRA